ncbi:MAG TPA: hypothetical protein VME46_07850 [Acidimicrobiales bacterium]|nr:hypothetical protein [Acidimicrobiales bacterium]
MITRSGSRFAIGIAALVASAVTSLSWVSLSRFDRSSADALPNPISGLFVPNSTSQVYNVYTNNVDSEEYSVAPGESVAGSASCKPNSQNGNLVSLNYIAGGGYLMSGSLGDSIASATASYPILTPKEQLGSLSATPDKWHVVVSNPKLASSSVNFRIRADCIVIVFKLGKSS